MLHRHTVSFTAPVWVFAGKASWYMVTLPQDAAQELMHFVRATSNRPRGWGAVRVQAQIGNTTWDTSMFPHKASDSYVLPLKASVRLAEGVKAKQSVHLRLSVPMP